jgi:hypothetical protein
VTKLENMVGKRVVVVLSHGGFVNNYIGKVGTISRVRPNKSMIFRVLVQFSANTGCPYWLVPLHEAELRYLNNKKVTLD